MALSISPQSGITFVSQAEQHSSGVLLRGSMPLFILPRLRKVVPLVAKIGQSQRWGVSGNAGKRFLVRSVATAEITDVLEEKDVLEEDVAFEEEEVTSPTIDEIQTLLSELCDETTIAELSLRVGSLKLKVKRDIGKSKGAAPAISIPEAPPIPSKPMVDSLPVVSAPPASKPSKTSALALAPLSSLTKPMSLLGFLEAAADEGLEFVTSPKVGLFRKGRVVKGKAGRPLCEEGQVVKEGQVVCYLEQLGTQQPVEATLSGEVVKVLWEEGAPVGYADPLIAIRPSFVGIKKLN